MVAGLTITDAEQGIDNHYVVMANGDVSLVKSQQPLIPIQKQTGNTFEFQPWGTDNKDPFRIWEEGNSIIEIQSGLDLRSRLLYGNGWIVGRITGVDAEGNEIFEPIWNKEINNFLVNAGFQRYLMSACTYYYWFNIVFPQIILSKDRKKITHITALDTTECRWGKQNQKNGLIEKCYVSANWRTTNNPTDTTILPVLNPFFTMYDLQNGKNFSYIYPLSYATPTQKYYPVPSWDAVRKSGWLKVAQKIPDFKLNVFEQQLSSATHIETTKQWWEWKFKGFEQMTQEERSTLVKAELQRFTNTMTGNNGAGKTIMSTGYVDDRTGNYIPGWKINKIDTKFGTGDYIEDSQEATSKIIAGLGIPSSLLNLLGTGSKMGGGSGTDIRVATNLYLNSVEAHRDLILEPWNFALRYNGFGDDLKIKLRYKQITTLQNGTESEPTN